MGSHACDIYIYIYIFCWHFCVNIDLSWRLTGRGPSGIGRRIGYNMFTAASHHLLIGFSFLVCGAMPFRALKVRV